MVEDSYDHDSWNERNLPSKKRRRLLASLGALAVPAVAGCTGENGEDDPTPTETEEDPGENGDENGDEGPSLERHDVTLELFHDPPIPADAQFNPFGPSQANITTGRYMRHNLANRSYYDQEVYGDMIKEYTYLPGVVEFELHDDFYFWNGENIDADTFVNWLEFMDYVSGGDELSYLSNVVSAEWVDDYTVRLNLPDAWAEDYALEQTIVTMDIDMSEEWFTPWLESFRDETGMEGISEIREELAELVENDPTHFGNYPFEIVDAEEDRYILELRTSDRIDYPEPHYVDQLNYTTIHAYTVEESGVRWTQSFREGNSPFIGPTATNHVDPDTLDFDVTDYSTFLPGDFGALTFNCSAPNTQDPHFRRAMTYLINRESLMEEVGTVERHGTTPFLTDEREEAWVSEDVRNAMTDYKWNEADFESAEAEMLRGDFERDSDGNWLWKEGEEAGEPMEFTLTAYEWQAYVEEQGGQLIDDLAEFGMSCEIQLDNDMWGRLTDGDFLMDFTTLGGGLPEVAFEYTFGTSPSGGFANSQLPETVEAPPVGEPAVAGDGEFSVTYETRSMTERLRTTTDPDRRQEILDELAWVSNQIVPRTPVRVNDFGYQMNTELVDMTSMSEAPELHVELPPRTMWVNGALSYRG